ncbi:MAG: class I SAM-dependent methyltransferase [Deltaproteobacteria bacterium]|nr:class I SAM-dependent methyltransferase [Deltaproteobacteria bacterium]
MATVAKTDTTNTQSAALINIVDRNMIVWWGLLLTSLLLAVFVTPWGCLFWMVALVVDDVLLYGLGKSILFDSQLRMRRNYQWMHNMYDNTTGSGRDLGFNLVVDGKLSQRAKYEHMVHELGLERGMVICDVGCGYGDWLKYCRDEIGCEAVGINITPEQARYARQEYGLDVHVTNWKEILTDSELQQTFYGRFDAVTFMDTVEHYVSMEDRRNIEVQEKIYSDMCFMASQLINRDSKSKRVFISCLHQTHKPRTCKFYFHAYFMDKFYSGHYPFVDEGPLKVCKPWFEVLNVADKTEDYRLTGVRDRKHFQAVDIQLTPKKVAYAICLSFLDPFVLHRLLYYGQDSWMSFYGENAYSEEYDADYRRSVSYVTLYWITLRLKSNPLGRTVKHKDALN